MVIKYEFVNGEKVESSVSNDLGTTMLQIERETKNNDRRETRRHQSLNAMQDKADMLIDKNINVEEDFLRRTEVDKLYEAISKLNQAEQALIHKLYLDKHPMTQAEYAKYLNIKEASVCQKVWRTKQKLKKLLEV